MEVAGLSYGRPGWHKIGGVDTYTSIVHTPVTSLDFTKNGVANNEVAAHDAPVYAMLAHHYDEWADRLHIERSEWEYGHWGENITFQTSNDLNEDDFNLGDTWRIGKVVELQVCGSRVPCAKLSWRCGQKDKWLKELADTGSSGIYLRILKGGTVHIGDPAVLVQKGNSTFNAAMITKTAFDSSLKTKDTMNLLVQEDDMLPMNKFVFNRKLMLMRDSELLNKNRWKGWRDLRVSKIVQESYNVKSFYLSPTDSKPLATYLPGQFLSIKLPSGLSRNWSISDWPSHDDPPFYRISIKREYQGSAWMHDKCEEGTILSVRPPAGRFVLDWAAMLVPRQVYVSAGIGITPILAMMKAHVSHPALKKTPAVWMHVAKDRSCAGFLDEILSCKELDRIKKIVYLTDELCKGFRDGHVGPEPVEFRYGRPGVQDFEKVMGQPYDISLLKPEPIELPAQKSSFYICGPSSFEAAVKDHLQNMNVLDSAIHSETFSIDQDQAQLADAEEALVKFKKSGKSSKWKSEKPKSILEIAEDAGLAPEYGCRMGACGSCKVKLIKGSVTGGVEEDGGVLICSARPSSAVVEIEA